MFVIKITYIWSDIIGVAFKDTMHVPLLINPSMSQQFSHTSPIHPLTTQKIHEAAYKLSRLVLCKFIKVKFILLYFTK